MTDQEFQTLQLLEAAEKVMAAIDQAITRGTLGPRTPIAEARRAYSAGETPKPLKQLRARLKAARRAAKNAELEELGVLTQRGDSTALYRLVLEGLRARCPGSFKRQNVRDLCGELGHPVMHENIMQRIGRSGSAQFHKEEGCWKWLDAEQQAQTAECPNHQHHAAKGAIKQSGGPHVQ